MADQAIIAVVAQRSKAVKAVLVHLEAVDIAWVIALLLLAEPGMCMAVAVVEHMVAAAAALAAQPLNILQA